MFITNSMRTSGSRQSTTRGEAVQGQNDIQSGLGSSQRRETPARSSLGRRRGGATLLDPDLPYLNTPKHEAQPFPCVPSAARGIHRLPRLLPRGPQGRGEGETHFPCV